MNVADYAFPPIPPIAALQAAGVTGVCRYLSWLPNNKVITKQEYDALLAAGISLALNWEYDAHDFINSGFDPRAAATESVRQARALGYPDTCAIYYSVDFDATPQQWPTIRDRFRNGPNAVHGVARTGIYGPYDVLQWAKQDGVAAWFWQAGMSTAWSGGRNAQLWPGAHLRQRRQTTISGADLDINDILQTNWGQHPTPGGTMADTLRLVQLNGDPKVYLTNFVVRYHVPDGNTLNGIQWWLTNKLGMNGNIEPVDNIAAFGFDLETITTKLDAILAKLNTGGTPTPAPIPGVGESVEQLQAAVATALQAAAASLKPAGS